MEASFDADFSSVRVHVGARAAAIGARAFTQGEDIHFAPGEYQPRAAQGRQVLGHELAHVVQQRKAPIRTTARVGGVAINDDPSLESEADRMSALAAQGQSAQVASARGAVGAAPLRPAGQPVQRYTVVKKDQNSLVSSTKSGLSFEVAKEHKKLFIQQVEGPHKDFGQIVYKGAHDEVSLRISENGRLAAEDVPQPKTFYAAEEHYKTSNEILEKNGSHFRLVPQPNSLTVGKGVDRHTLHQLLPKNIKNDTEGLGTKSFHPCDRMKTSVTGTGAKRVRHAGSKSILNGPLAPIQKLILRDRLRGIKESEDPIPSTVIELLNDAWVKKNVGVLARFRDAFKTGDPPDVELENLLRTITLSAGNIDTLVNTAPFSDLNLHFSDVQENARLRRELKDLYHAVVSYQTFRAYKLLKSDQREELACATGINEHADPEVGEAYRVLNLERSFTEEQWNYHWAGVVAKDGPDTVTLENYNRIGQGDNKSGCLPVPNQNREEDPRWYFRMYGPREQSFHAVNAARLPKNAVLTQVFGPDEKTEKTDEPSQGAGGRLLATLTKEEAEAVMKILEPDMERRRDAKAQLNGMLLLGAITIAALAAAIKLVRSQQGRSK